MSRFKRKRCPCGKAVYLTREEAHGAIGGLVDIDPHRDLLSIYKCSLLKRGWHIGHNHKKYQAFEKETNCQSPAK